MRVTVLAARLSTDDKVPPMTRALRRSLAIETALAVLCLVGACLVLVWSPSAADAKSKPSAKFAQESMQAYEQQLASGQIKVARFSPAKHTVRLTLKDGSHVHVTYAHGEEPKLRAALLAKGVSLPAVAKPKVSHKNRYIAAGAVVLVLILIAIGVVLFIRRRRASDDYDE
jgi:ATP-dependent Zn protease